MSPIRKQDSMIFSKLPETCQLAIAAELCRRVGFAGHHAEMLWDNHHPTIEPTVRAAAQALKSVYIGGTLRVGKTGYLACMLKEAFLAEARKSEFRQSHLELTAFLQKGVVQIEYENLITFIHTCLKDQNEVAIEELKNSRILIIDEFGFGADDSKGFNVGQVTSIINHRWANQLTTWIASNIHLPRLKKRPGWERMCGKFTDERWMTPPVFIKEPNRHTGR